MNVPRTGGQHHGHRSGAAGSRLSPLVHKEHAGQLQICPLPRNYSLISSLATDPSCSPLSCWKLNDKQQQLRYLYCVLVTQLRPQGLSGQSVPRLLLKRVYVHTCACIHTLTTHSELSNSGRSPDLLFVGEQHPQNAGARKK